MSENTGAADPTGRPMPPYDDRQRSGEVASEGVRKDGANVGGATGPVASAELKSPPKEETPRGAAASPSDEQPAADRPETDRDDDAVGPSHYTGTGSGENQSEGKR